MASQHECRPCESVLIQCARLALGLSVAAVVLPLYVGAKVYQKITRLAREQAGAEPKTTPSAPQPVAERALPVAPTAPPPAALTAEAAAPEPSAEEPAHAEHLAPGVWLCPHELPVDAWVGGTEGDKYHRPSCRWVSNIQSGNRICFASAQAAQAYGYSPCGTCKPT